MTSAEKKIKTYAAVATIGISFLIIVVLLVSKLTWDKEFLTAENNPELLQEELYIEAELLNIGEENAKNIKEPLSAPAPLGQPEEASEANDKLRVKGENSHFSQQREKLVSTDKESTVKQVEPQQTEKESKINSSVKNSFEKNGNSSGKETGSSIGTEDGIGTNGSLKGRKFEGCPTPSLKVQKAVTIVVSVTVNAQGSVVAASFLRDSGAGQGNSSLRNACVNASRKAKFSAKSGAVEAKGTITWNLKPKS